MFESTVYKKKVHKYRNPTIDNGEATEYGEVSHEDIIRTVSNRKLNKQQYNATKVLHKQFLKKRSTN